MKRQLLLIVRQERTLGAGLLVVHFVHVRGEALGTRRLVLAQRACKRLQVSVEMPLQAPVVHTGPRAVAASVPPLPLLEC